MPVERLHTHVVKTVCQTSLLLFLSLVSLAIFCLDQLTEIVCPAQHQLSLHWLGDNSLVHMNLE